MKEEQISRSRAGNNRGAVRPNSNYLAPLLKSKTEYDCSNQGPHLPQNKFINTNGTFYIYLGVSVAMMIISIVAIYVLHRQKTKQPLRKISPNLMIVSVLGNFFCIINICFCLTLFEMFDARQDFCNDKENLWDYD
jgi:hypothetical protein